MAADTLKRMIMMRRNIENLRLVLMHHLMSERALEFTTFADCDRGAMELPAHWSPVFPCSVFVVPITTTALLYEDCNLEKFVTEVLLVVVIV